MALFDRFKKWYLVKVRCYNCGHTQDCKVPKGMTIDSHLKTEAAQCENCGNATLRRIELVRVPQEMRTPAKQYIKEPQLPPLPPLRRRVITPPQRRPQSRPARPVYRQRPQPQPQEEYPYDNQVDYPVNEPVPTKEEEVRPGFEQPEWTPKPKRINFWTGRDDIQ